MTEGFCPEHRAQLGDSGWCPGCGQHGGWWTWEPAEERVVLTYFYPPEAPPFPRYDSVRWPP